MSTVNYPRTVRIAIAVLSALVLLQCFLLFAQHRQVNQLTAIDCAALEERRDRVELYMALIEYWESRDDIIASAYRSQLESVAKVVSAGEKECD